MTMVTPFNSLWPAYLSSSVLLSFRGCNGQFRCSSYLSIWKRSSFSATTLGMYQMPVNSKETEVHNAIGSTRQNKRLRSYGHQAQSLSQPMEFSAPTSRSGQKTKVRTLLSMELLSSDGRIPQLS